MAARSIERVLIAGAGPTGLVTGLALGLQGIPVLIFESLPAPSRAIRASTFHPPTLDMLEALDVTAELVEAGEVVRTWQVRDRKQGKIAEAKELLAGIYGWFTEGFDTPDLIEAKALLEEL